MQNKKIYKDYRSISLIATNVKNKERMENRNRIIELLTTVRYTTNDIGKVADEICSLFSVVEQSEQLVCDDCGYEINPAGICINMNCSTNENP